jgi:hypothetical protein
MKNLNVSNEHFFAVLTENVHDGARFKLTCGTKTESGASGQVGQQRIGGVLQNSCTEQTM